MIPAPAYWSIGMNASTPIARHAPTGVCSVGCTATEASTPGSCSSRAIPKRAGYVEAWIERQQTKIAAETTSR